MCLQIVTFIAVPDETFVAYTLFLGCFGAVSGIFDHTKHRNPGLRTRSLVVITKNTKICASKLLHITYLFFLFIF